MEPIIFIHGSGQKADSWRETVSFLPYKEKILCPELSAVLKGQKASYPTSARLLRHTAPRPERRFIYAAFPWAGFWLWTTRWNTRKA